MGKNGAGSASAGSAAASGPGSGPQGGAGPKPRVIITPGAPKKKEPSQRDRLIEIAVTSGITYWHDADGNAFATASRDARIERYRVRSAPFKRLLRRLYGEAYPNIAATKKAGGTVPGGVSDTAMNEALPTLEALAQTGPTREPAVRVCCGDDDDVWLDLCDETWRLVKITAAGWEIVDAADVPLVRTNGMRALPAPAPDPDALAKLRALLNLNPVADKSKALVKRADQSFILITNFMLVVLYPRGPYPILSVNGEHGSAKTTACWIVRMCTDPNKAPMRSVPRNPDDLFVTSQHSRLLPLDNVSHLFPELADVLCGIATGSGRGARQLYTDGDETILGACNPIMINGIEGLLTRADLADRCLSVMLTEISDEVRRDEAEMRGTIAAAVPGILALLLDAMATAIRALPTLKLSRMPRMADFTRLACAAAPAFGWTADDVFTAIMENRQIAVEAVIDADPVATAVLAFLEQRQAAPQAADSTYLWIGTATELLGILKRFVPEETVKSRTWPKLAHQLSGRLKRAAPALRNRGFTILTGGRTNVSRKIAFQAIDRRKGNGVSASPASQRHSDNLFNDLDVTEEVTLNGVGASPDNGSGRSKDDQVTLDDVGASPAASPENYDYAPDIVDEYRYGDAGDTSDADLPLPSNTEEAFPDLGAPLSSGHHVDNPTEYDDDEGEL
jgi:hypothetical protein